MKQTNEQLIAEAAKLRQSHENWVAGDERKRKEFAKAFNWWKTDYYDKSKEPQIPTWEQIFIEVGKLLVARNFMDFEGNLSELESKIENHIRDTEKHFDKKDVASS